MCGIVGVITKNGIGRNDEKFITQGLYVDALRGMHSTGLAAVHKNGDVTTVKRAMSAYDFMGLKAVDSFFNRWNVHRAYIGHNRHATQGEVNNVNAHPFTIGDITMVHNGSLTNRVHLPDHHRFDVDSENICHSLNEIGPHETLKKLQGSFALVWHNAAEDKIYMARNNLRDLSFGVTNFGDVYFASEEGMLTWIANRNKIDFKTIYDVTPKHLISFDLAGNRMDKYECEEVEYYTPPPTSVYHRENVQKSKNKGNKSGGKGGNTGKDLSVLPGVSDETKKERYKRQTTMLDLAGFKRNEAVEFTPFEFSAYAADTHGRTGVVRGCLSQEPFCSIEVHSVNEADFEFGSTYVAPIMSVRNLSKGEPEVHTLSLILDGRDVICAHEDMEEEDDGTFASAEVELPFQDEHEKGGDEFLFLTGPDDKLIPAEEWDKLTSKGCCQCTGNLDQKDHKEIKWMAMRQPMCPKCVEEWEAFATGKSDVMPEKAN